MSRSLQQQVLSRAIALVEAGWTYGAFARDHHGRKVPVFSPRAVRFCGLGAIERAHHDLGLDVPIVSMSERERAVLVARNDVHGKEETIRLLRDASPFSRS